VSNFDQPMNKIFYNTNGDSISVIRFYSDKEVIGSTFGNFEEFDDKFIKMFDKNGLMSYLWSKGKYIITSNKIEFDLTSNHGTVKYYGKFNSDKELVLSSESLINGHKSTRRYNTIDCFPENNEQLSISDNFYPIILIPNKIQTAILNEVADEKIYKHLNITLPKLEKLKEPSFPNSYKYVKKEKTEYVGDGCMAIAHIPMVVFFAIMFFYSLGKTNIILTLIFLGGAILLGANLGKFKTKTIDERIDLSNEEFEKLKAKYREDLKKIRDKNIELEKEYNLNKENIELRIKNTKQDIALKEYYQSLKPTSEVIRHKENIKRGKTELMFLDRLFKKFGSQIKVDIAPDINSQFYFPDFAFICNKTGLHIDIEIDEPYSFIEKLPIHHTESNDNERNKFFLEKNWLVIRFSEKQIIQETENCIKVIENTITALQNKSDIIDTDLTKEKKWSYEEALVMSYNNTRNEY